MSQPSTKPHLVIFCGAGFSVPIGIPTMDGFADALRMSGFLTPEDQADLDHVQTICNELSSIIGASARNLEQLASFLSILEVARPELRFSGCRPELQEPNAVLSLVKKCIAFIAQPHLNGLRTLTEDTLLKLATSANITFITTNYDLHIEYKCLSYGIPVSAIHSSAQRESRLAELGEQEVPLYRRADDAGPKLFKLHGSVNWVLRGNQIVFDDIVTVTDWHYPNGKRSPQAYTLRSMSGEHPAQRARESCRNHERLIIPPTVLKPGMFTNELIRAQWQGAAEAIRDADYLWFIGYSFPESDSFMRFFLAAALLQNVRIRQIALCDPNREVLDKRAKPLFCSPRHREVLWSVPLGWMEAGLDSVYHKDLNRLAENVMFVHSDERRAARNLIRGGY